MAVPPGTASWGTTIVVVVETGGHVKRTLKEPPQRGSQIDAWPADNCGPRTLESDSGPWWYVYTVGDCSGKFASSKGVSLGLTTVASACAGERERSSLPRLSAATFAPSVAMSVWSSNEATSGTEKFELCCGLTK